MSWLSTDIVQNARIRYIQHTLLVVLFLVHHSITYHIFTQCTGNPYSNKGIQYFSRLQYYCHFIAFLSPFSVSPFDFLCPVIQSLSPLPYRVSGSLPYIFSAQPLPVHSQPLTQSLSTSPVQLPWFPVTRPTKPQHSP